MTTEHKTFDTLVNRAMAIENRTHMRPVVEKELLHYDILFALDQAHLLDHLTFQGGTSLRLCYGSPRFSEDLDFTGGKNFSTAYLINMKDCLEKYLYSRYGLDVSVKEPKDMMMLPEERDVKVDKWQLSITTAPERKDLPKQKIKIEIINIPSYSRSPRPLLHNYDFLPDGYSDTLIMTETIDEIMADKLVSLVNCVRYVRHRDIWDLRWLTQQGAQIQPNFVRDKIKDYRITDYPSKLDNLLGNINKIINGKNFHDEISRFIPIDTQERTIKKDKFLEFLTNETKKLLIEVKRIYLQPQKNHEFEIG